MRGEGWDTDPSISKHLSEHSSVTFLSATDTTAISGSQAAPNGGVTFLVWGLAHTEMALTPVWNFPEGQMTHMYLEGIWLADEVKPIISSPN